MTIPTPAWDIELAHAHWQAASASAPMLKLVPKAAQTSALITVVNTDLTETFPTGYTSWGGIGSGGIQAAIKSTAGTTADADFTGATPALPAPPIGTMVYNTNTHKLQIRDAAASWLISAAFT
jgi:hypothetical protein